MKTDLLILASVKAATIFANLHAAVVPRTLDEYSSQSQLEEAIERLKETAHVLGYDLVKKETE